MKSEYVKLTMPEKHYGQKNLLQAQLESLSSIKRLKSYRALRKDELVLKVSLKSKIGEMLSLLDTLDRLFPKIESKSKSKEFIREREKKDLTLEEEINKVRIKLKRLQNKA